MQHGIIFLSWRRLKTYISLFGNSCKSDRGSIKRSSRLQKWLNFRIVHCDLFWNEIAPYEKRNYNYAVINFHWYNDVFQPPGHRPETENEKALCPVGWKGLLTLASSSHYLFNGFISCRSLPGNSILSIFDISSTTDEKFCVSSHGPNSLISILIVF